LYSLCNISQEEKTWKSSWASSKGRTGRDRFAQIQSAIHSQGAYLAGSRPVANGASGGPLAKTVAVVGGLNSTAINSKKLAARTRCVDNESAAP
jgi:hypothetical protein